MLVNNLQLLALLLLAPAVRCANILCLLSSPSPSHLIVHMAVVKTLADRGHNMTVVSILEPRMQPHENITYILVPPNKAQLQLYIDHVEGMAKQQHSTFVDMYKLLVNSANLLDIQSELLQHAQMRDIYEGQHNKYDLLFLGYCLNDFLLGVAAKLNLPVIVNWVGVPLEFTDSLVGNNNDAALVPSFNVVQPAGERFMGFRLRLHNYMTWLFFKLVDQLVRYRSQKYYERIFGQAADMPSYAAARARISMLFSNYHSHSEGPIRATMPQSIEIGGIQIKEQRTPLPADIAEFLQAAHDGAILFSLGTNLKESIIKPQTLAAIYKVLSQLPQRVIWKWDNLQQTPGNASNIIYKQWLPQDDILAHANLKLFIMHAGKGGIAEAQYHGVPMLALPVYADQPGNAHAMAASGFGLALHLLTLDEQSFGQSIHELLTNSSYRNNVRRFSALYRDRPLTARQSVVYWTEYVLRHRGAYHLQSPHLHMHFIARHNWDVYALLLSLLAAGLLLLRWLLKFLWRRCMYSGQHKVKLS